MYGTAGGNVPSIPVVDGHVQLGTWQSIVLVDLNRDNPQRKVRFSFLEG